jgi:hypothetical protein
MVKVEVRRKEEGARFMLKGIWACPPFHRYLWDSVQELLVPRVTPRS